MGAIGWNPLGWVKKGITLGDQALQHPPPGTPGWLRTGYRTLDALTNPVDQSRIVDNVSSGRWTDRAASATKKTWIPYVNQNRSPYGATASTSWNSTSTARYARRHRRKRSARGRSAGFAPHLSRKWRKASGASYKG